MTHSDGQLALSNPSEPSTSTQGERQVMIRPDGTRLVKVTSGNGREMWIFDNSDADPDDPEVDAELNQLFVDSTNRMRAEMGLPPLPAQPHLNTADPAAGPPDESPLASLAQRTWRGVIKASDFVASMIGLNDPLFDVETDEHLDRAEEASTIHATSHPGEDADGEDDDSDADLPAEAAASSWSNKHNSSAHEAFP
ncbi:hypothetical protein, variant [Fonticula alba]|uniref:Uncharacterized protein n=1 Tax=Fonticula alba TaxID=691883 RepID=A0A058ZG80_FONAL|nr:hypothetical protein, variant [Fonticula alba]KCV73405.1 hypothetical protein, variant [Fonticula alba]|eukprot:XP_009493106.1 hypothetical protein, variant [Fonticula alba]